MKARSSGGRQAALAALLEERRDAVASPLQALGAALPAEAPATKDLEDHAVEDIAREMEFALAQMRSATLQRIEESLRRLADGTYGLCADCHAEIPEARLRALPFASLCHDCQEQRESLRIRTRSVEGVSGSRPHAI